MKIINGIAGLVWRLGALGTFLWICAGLGGGFAACLDLHADCHWVPYVVGIPSAMLIIGLVVHGVTYEIIEWQNKRSQREDH